MADRIGSDVNVAAKMGGADEPIDKVATLIAVVANANIPTAKLSVETAFLTFPVLASALPVDDVNCPNYVDPRRQHAMKHVKSPTGPRLLLDSTALIALLDAGLHLLQTDCTRCMGGGD
jgi:hypothetical protein